MDICIWAYLPDKREYNNQMQIIVGRHTNCDYINMWSGDNLTYELINHNEAREMHRMCRDYIMNIILKNLDRTYEVDIPKI